MYSSTEALFVVVVVVVVVAVAADTTKYRITSIGFLIIQRKHLLYFYSHC